MARVCIDNAYGEGWFSKILNDLVENKNVRFVYTTHKKLQKEISLKKNLLEIYKRVSLLGRLDSVDAKLIEKRMKALESHQAWKNAKKVCDDPHIFAMVFEKPTPFVFSKDSRMAKCRDCINPHMDGRYCSFRLVSSAANYKMKRHEILA